MRTAGRAFRSLIYRVTPIETKSCFYPINLHQNTSTVRQRQTLRRAGGISSCHLDAEKQNGTTTSQRNRDPHRTYLLMSCSEIVDDKRAQYKTVNSVKKSIKVTSEVLRKRKVLVHGLLLTAISCRKVEQKELSWKVKQSVYIKEIKKQQTSTSAQLARALIIFKTPSFVSAIDTLMHQKLSDSRHPTLKAGGLLCEMTDRSGLHVTV